jgi:hypothetical protein
MEVVMSFLSSFGGSFGSVLSDSGFPGGYIKGFALSVDAITNDSSLGGNWQTMSLGTMEMHTNELPAGGYIRTSIREVERISYGEVTVARAWSPGTSARITEWFSWAAKNGSTSVAITVEVPSASEAGIGGLFASLVSSLAVATGMDPSDLPGKKFNIANGLAAWASMNAIIQTVQLDLATGSTTIAIGPPKHLSPDDMVALLKRIRSRTMVTQQVSRHTGLAGDHGVLGGGRLPRNEAAAEGGEPLRTVYAETGTDTRKIDLDPTEIPDAEGALTLKPREIVCLDGANLKARSVMATESYGDSQGALAATAVTVLTAIQYDTSTGYIQVKTRTLRAIDISAESSWTNAIETAECTECDEA